MEKQEKKKKNKKKKQKKKNNDFQGNVKNTTNGCGEEMNKNDFIKNMNSNINNMDKKKQIKSISL